MAAEHLVRMMKRSTVGMAGLVLLSALTVAQSPRVAATGPDRAVMMTHVTVDADNLPLIAVLQQITQQAGLTPAYDGAMLPAGARVTVHLRQILVGDALREALRGTGLAAEIRVSGTVFIGRDASVSRVRGTIAGSVTDATTKRPVAGALVTLDGASKGVTTTTDGVFRFDGVSAGGHTVTVKRLGYGLRTQTVTAADGVVTLAFALESSANVLDQVVVTGTVVQTELKAVPNAITVITAKQIEERGITKIDQFFRGDVPGLFAQNQGAGALLDEVTMYSRGATALSNASSGLSSTGGASFLTNPIKTYVDGVELANPTYISQIDPKSIERIEILTGPQASTIYGSNAINGVMQVFTKRGMSNAPQLTLNLLNGWVENNFSPAHTPQHDYSAQLNGLEGRMSYNAGASWDYMGRWTPAKQLARLGGFGGVRLELPTPAGRVTSDVTLRRSLTQNLQRGANNQTQTGYRETGWYTRISGVGLDYPTTYTLMGQTLGLTLSYVPASWWSHELGVGVDASDAETRVTARRYASLADTTLSLSQSHTDRRSMRYTATARFPVTSLAQATITVGADAWQNLASTWSVSPQALTGSLTGASSVSRQPGHNTGGFFQTQLGIKDRMFFTYGLRAEWNPDFGEAAQPNYAPRYGVAYTQDLGIVTAKVRGGYGRSTRPPQPTLKAEQTVINYYASAAQSAPSSTLNYYGNIDVYLGNPDLAPEYQQGGEGGLELYFGNRGSLVVTRYNQTVDGLIAQPLVDSARSLVPCPTATCDANSRDANGYGYLLQYQYANIGSIRNQGWELQGSVNTGPFTTKGTYSWTKSRTIGVSAKYHSFFSNGPQYQPGATFQYLPEHTWMLGMTYARATSSVGLNVTGTGRVTNAGDDFFFRNLISNIRLSQNRLNISNPFARVFFNHGYALADLTVSRRIAARMEGVLQVQNLMDRYTNDYYGGYASLGRQIKAGLRWSM